jgi:hypothetical protein
MRIRAIFVFACVALKAYGAQACPPPSAAIAEVRAYLSYENGLGKGGPQQDQFTSLTVGDRTFFRLNTPPPDFAADSRPVYVYEPGKEMRGYLTCPPDAAWISCVADWLRSTQTAIVSRGEQLKGPTCELTVDVPAWRPSPDNRQKRELAGDLLKEIRGFGYADAKAIYIRDFNVNDPDIWAYIITHSGNSEFQACSFNSRRTPHCQGWHGFGQTPVDWLKQKIMEEPYRLYPPPAGKP